MKLRAFNVNSTMIFFYYIYKNIEDQSIVVEYEYEYFIAVQS